MYQARTLGDVTSGATGGAAVGSAVPGIGTAIGGAVGAVAGLLSGKVHHSPWGFLYDDYPQNIYQNEVQIRQAKNAIAHLQGQPEVPMPPMYSKTGGAQYQASMQDIVPKYVPGSEQQIASYSRTLNEPGGAYERTVQIQLGLIPQLQAQMRALQGSSIIASGIPIAGSATMPPQPQLMFQAPIPTTASTFQIPQSSYQPSPFSPSPSPQYAGAGMMDTSALGGYAPYIIGAIGLAVILLNQRQSPAPRRSRMPRRSPRRR
jgi:hypothetical protein